MADKIELMIESTYVCTRYQITNPEVRRKLLEYVPELRIVLKNAEAINK